MKNYLLKMSILFVSFLFHFQSFAGITSSLSSEDVAIVNFDESEIYASFDQINDLVSYVSGNDAVAYTDIHSENNSMVENVCSSAAMVMNTSSSDNPLTVGAFWYGCIFSAVGIIVVAVVTDNDPAQVKKAVTGCMVTTIGIPVLYIVSVLLLSASSYLSVGY